MYGVLEIGDKMTVPFVLFKVQKDYHQYMVITAGEGVTQEVKGITNFIKMLNSQR